MSDFFNIQSPSFLGGTNVQNVVILAGISILLFKAWQK